MIVKVQPLFSEVDMVRKAFRELEGESFKEYMKMFMYSPHPLYGLQRVELNEKVLKELVKKRFMSRLENDEYGVWIQEWHCGV